MKFADAVPLIKDGDVLFFHGTNFVDTSIEEVTDSNYSHVNIAFWATIAGTPRLMVVECQGKTRQRVVNLDFYKDYKFDVIAAPVDWKTYSDKALEGIGHVKYGYFAALYTGIRDFCFKHFHWTLPSLNFAGEICSEFAARCIGLPCVDVSPQDDFQALVAQGHKISISVR